MESTLDPSAAAITDKRLLLEQCSDLITLEYNCIVEFNLRKISIT